jgi:hypothetical protein
MTSGGSRLHDSDPFGKVTSGRSPLASSAMLISSQSIDPNGDRLVAILKRSMSMAIDNSDENENDGIRTAQSSLMIIIIIW